jgi:acyl-CoA hydrolase
MGALVTRQLSSPAAAAALIGAQARAAPVARVALPGGAAEATCLVEAWRTAPEHADGLIFTGLLTPGINRTDYAALGADARLETVILSPDWRESFAAGRVAHLPMHYSAAFQRLCRADIAVAVLHVSQPNAEGLCSFGLAADSGPAFCAADPRPIFRLGLINRAMPYIADGPVIALERFDALLEGEWPLLTVEAAPASLDAIATRVAALIKDGDTLQIGIGKLPSAILAALTTRRNLRIHSGLISPAVGNLLDAGAVAHGRGAITTGLVLGDRAFLDRMACEPSLRMASVAATHAQSRLCAIDNFVSINAALEIDLFGQINAELAGGRQIAGSGGMADFVRGARASRGGRAIIAITATGKSGDCRIVPRLTGPITLARTDSPIIVTEYGSADLSRLDLDARADAIAALAPPDQRDALRVAWESARASL